MFRAVGVILILPALYGAVVAGDAGHEERTWRNATMCPVNSLYILAKVKGIPLTYSEIEQGLSTHFRGNSIKEMRDFANSKGLKAEVVKAGPEYLTRCPLPVIAHCEGDEGGTGHYVVIMGASAGQVEVIDGTTAVISTQSMREFRKAWTGYLLVCQATDPWVYVAPLVSGLAALGIVCSKWYSVRHRAAGSEVGR